MSLHFDFHLASRLKSLGRALRARLSGHTDEPTPRAHVSPEPTLGRRPDATPSDGVPVITEASPTAPTIRFHDPLSPDQLAYGQDAFHPDAEPGQHITDDDQLDDGRTWMEALAADSIESGPVGSRPLVIDDDGKIHR